MRCSPSRRPHEYPCIHYLILSHPNTTNTPSTHTYTKERAQEGGGLDLKPRNGQNIQRSTYDTIRKILQTPSTYFTHAIDRYPCSALPLHRVSSSITQGLGYGGVAKRLPGSLRHQYESPRANDGTPMEHSP